jgi:hypothetical protein
MELLLVIITLLVFSKMTKTAIKFMTNLNTLLKMRAVSAKKEKFQTFAKMRRQIVLNMDALKTRKPILISRLFYQAQLSQFKSVLIWLLKMEPNMLALKMDLNVGHPTRSLENMVNQSHVM